MSAPLNRGALKIPMIYSGRRGDLFWAARSSARSPLAELRSASLGDADNPLVSFRTPSAVS